MASGRHEMDDEIPFWNEPTRNENLGDYLSEETSNG